MAGARLAESRLLPALIVSASAGSMALAQADEPCGLPLHEITTPPAGMSFAPRTEVNQLVYSVASPSEGALFRGTGGRSHTVQQGIVEPLAPGLRFPLAVNALAYGYVCFGDGVDANGVTLPHFDLLVTLHDTYAPPPGGQPPFVSGVIGSLRVNNIAPNWGFIEWLQNPVQLVDAAGANTYFLLNDAEFAYEYQIFEAGTNRLWGTSFATGASSSTDQIVPSAAGPTGTIRLLGGGALSYFGNNPAAQGGPSYADIVGTPVGSQSNPRCIYLKLRSDVIIDFFPDIRQLGTLNCAAGQVNEASLLLPGSVRWFSFTLASPVSVDARTFLDATVAQSAGQSVNADFALYTDTGDLIAADRDDGTGQGAQLSFGHGRRDGVGDGLDADGRDGDLPAGVYYLAVTGSGAVFAPHGFGVDASETTDLGEVTLTIIGNTGPVDCPLLPPTAPTAGELGRLRSGPTHASIAPSAREVAWLTFTTVDDVLPGNGNFLDITTDATTEGDPEIGLYSSDGVLIASDDDGGGGRLARIALGHGSAETLPAGRYYLGAGLFDVDFRADGWQARSNSGSTGSIDLTLRTRPCPTDLNADGVVDPDDLADAIACFFDPACQFDYDVSGGEDPDDLSTFISDYFDAGFCRP